MEGLLIGENMCVRQLNLYRQLYKSSAGKSSVVAETNDCMLNKN